MRACVPLLRKGLHELLSLREFLKLSLGERQVSVHGIVMGDTEYSVIDTSDTTSSGIGIDY